MEFVKPTMEDVTLDHNMELPGDHQGPVDNHDEIEIDLDIAHDPAEDGDVDVVVDDASVAASGGGLDAAHDADMLDDEGHALNPEYTFHQEEQQQYVDDGEYHGDDTYEAEMEDDFEEDIDAPIPGTSTLQFSDAVPEEVHHRPDPSHPQDHGSPANDISKSPAKTPPESTRHEAPLAESAVEEDHENYDQPAEDFEGEDAHGEEGQEGRGLEQDNEAHGRSPTEPSPQGKEQTATVYHPAEGPQESVAPEGPQDYEHAEDSGSHEEDRTDYHVTKEVDGNVNLHNIKVIYQETEISLFPPMEDDPTETYFLEDTGLAHEPIRNLFHACRLVLNDHIGEDEELVLEIDCLNLHLSQVRTIVWNWLIGFLLTSC